MDVCGIVYGSEQKQMEGKLWRASLRNGPLQLVEELDV